MRSTAERIGWCFAFLGIVFVLAHFGPGLVIQEAKLVQFNATQAGSPALPKTNRNSASRAKAALLPAGSTVSGPLTLRTGVVDSGYGTTPWNSPGNVAARDSTYAAYLGSGSESQYLKATNPGFCIAPGQKIDGIEVTWRRSCGGGNCLDTVISLVFEGSVAGSNRSLGETWSSTLNSDTFGGPNDLWGLQWTPEHINSPGFGAALAAKTTSLDTAFVDDVEITVYHHPSDPCSTM